MKSLFDPTVKEEILKRISSVTPDAKRQWGKMEVSQMAAHCLKALEMATGTLNPKRVFIGRLIGPMFRKKYSDEKPFDQSSPTSKELMIQGTPDLENVKNNLSELVRKFSKEKVTKEPHPFFGPLTPEEWGIGMYKHLDHHLRQFSN